MPCRALNPKLKSMYEKYKTRNFEIVSISLDDDKVSWKKAVVQDNLNWIQLIDEKSFDGELEKYYDIGAIPQSVLLDKSGRIISFNLSNQEIENILNKSF